MATPRKRDRETVATPYAPPPAGVPDRAERL